MVIEDAAHAHGASDSGRPAGSLGHMASFSFQSSKNLTAGEGGIIITNDDASPRPAARFTIAAACPTASGTSTTSSPATTASANFRARCSTRSSIASRSRPRRAMRTAAISRHASPRCPASIRRRGRRRARGTAITCSWLRLDAAAFGAPRAAVLDALRAEGIPCSAGYGCTLPRQPVFRDKAFGPYLAGAAVAPRLHRAGRPLRERRSASAASRRSGSNSTLMLGARADIDDIARAFEKVHEHRDALSRRRRDGDRAPAPSTPTRIGSRAALAALTDNHYLAAVRAGMVAVVPLTIVGGLFTILSHLPFASWDALVAPHRSCCKCRSPRRSVCSRWWPASPSPTTSASAWGRKRSSAPSMTLVVFLMLQIE